jgi:hypothetical protein
MCLRRGGLGVHGGVDEVPVFVRYNPASLRTGLPMFRDYILFYLQESKLFLDVSTLENETATLFLNVSNPVPNDADLYSRRTCISCLKVFKVLSNLGSLTSQILLYCVSKLCSSQLTPWRAVSWLRRLVAGLSPRRPGFYPGSVNVGFVVDKVAQGQVFPRELRFSPVTFIPPVLH